jgi:hypothetical protein
MVDEEDGDFEEQFQRQIELKSLRIEEDPTCSARPELSEYWPCRSFLAP